MGKILSLFTILFICACVSQKKYNKLQEEYAVLYKENQRQSHYLALTNEANEQRGRLPKVYFSHQPLEQNPYCPATTKPIKSYTVSTYQSTSEFNLGFSINDDFTMFPNRILNMHYSTPQAMEENFSKICLLAYASCDNNLFLSHRKNNNPDTTRTYYRLIHTLDTFWVGGCQWAVDSITQHLARGSMDKKLAVYGARHKYGYDVYLQCTDCVSAYKNEKGECLCSR